jgi:hypothetical protein
LLLFRLREREPEDLEPEDLDDPDLDEEDRLDDPPDEARLRDRDRLGSFSSSSSSSPPSRVSLTPSSAP